MTTFNLKKVFTTCSEKFCSINGALVGGLLDEGMRQKRAMLAQAETRSKAPFGDQNGRPDKSDGLNQQFTKLRKELTLAQREIKFQEPTTPSQGEYREGTCGARFQEQEG